MYIFFKAVRAERLYDQKLLAVHDREPPQFRFSQNDDLESASFSKALFANIEQKQKGEDPINKSLDTQTVSEKVEPKVETASAVSDQKSLNSHISDEIDLSQPISTSEESNETSGTQKSTDPDAKPDVKQEDVSMESEEEEISICDELREALDERNDRINYFLERARVIIE